jgi:hypothetical protein
MLYFQCRGEYFKVDNKGNMTQGKNDNFSGNWKFLGVSFHHWRKGIDLPFEEAVKNPSKLIGGLVWDLDHGTLRRWSGQYSGKLPRIMHAYSDSEQIITDEGRNYA